MKNLAHTARRLFALAWSTDRSRLLKAIALLALGYLATPAVALALRAFTDHLLSGGLAVTLTIGIGIAAALVIELSMGHFAHLYYFEVGEQAESRINSELIGYANATPGVEHLDSSEFADTVALVREELQKLRAHIEALLQLGALAVQLLLTTAILGSLEPWLLLLPVAALPPVLMGRYAQRFIDRSRTDSAQDNRRARHLLHVATTPSSAKEARISGAEPALLRLHDQSWERATRRLWRGQMTGAALRALGQIAFALACYAAIYLVIRQAVRGTVSLGDVVLAITLAVQVNVQVAAALSMLSALQAASYTVQRLETLRTWPTRPARPPRGEGRTVAAVPSRLRRGIRLENVGFTYPGTDRPVLRDVTLDLPAGRTVALVGENGAGKSTLVKLLCGLYEPTHGRILVDGVDLREVPPQRWKARVCALFQDFARLEFTLRENVGAGALDRMHDDQALLAAVRAGGADAVVERVPGGLDGPLGRGYTDGAELSGGQWQSLGLARTALRRRPLLLVLDEPAAALDAAAEHAVFQRYAGSAGEVGDQGGVTLFVSHRFSTVRMADRIVVLDGGTVLESGDHDELVARQGLYADLFALQARSYR
ncbi:ABC transporter ATP-binding protein [Streptomyces sp. MST-110588]|uniref:ABC transporter ATP-binding protein n=1 Tax=Streptomyces sp. MST-110588 TaxID=2833628 RepID=UPI001F5C2F46|nr:ABC transporter ATP-binding protein [Streptomyces sp. MST-110588]UNO39190.1 ABC transporter ATP-binding protein [Streptomyces sp. MST-110588]